MNASFESSLTGAEAQFGRKLAARLTAGTVDLPHESAERLRAARVQALARRKVAQQLRTAPVVVSSGGASALGGGWWTRVATFAPLVALVVGLVAVNILQDEHRASEIADVDAALLTDELPPAAYTDPGFLQFLKTDEGVSR
jgi:hypothetical protein